MMSFSLSLCPRSAIGALHPERAGDGRDGAGDQHDGDPHQDRGAEQAGEGGGEAVGEDTFPTAGNCTYVFLPRSLCLEKKTTTTTTESDHGSAWNVVLPHAVLRCDSRLLTLYVFLFLLVAICSCSK